MWMCEFTNGLLFVSNVCVLTTPLDISDRELLNALIKIPEAWHEAGYCDDNR